MKYATPDVYVERFTMNTAVAANSSCISETSDLAPCDITCIINGTEKIFTQNTSGCTTKVAVDSNYIQTYDGTTYFVWSNGDTLTLFNYEGCGSLTDPDTATLNALVEMVTGSEIGEENSAGWHAGPVTTDISSAYYAS